MTTAKGKKKSDRSGGSSKVKGIHPILVFSSKRQLHVLRDIVKSRGSVRFILFAVDGTWRLDSGQGVVINLAVTTVYLEKNGNIIHRTYVIFHIWARTENQEAAQHGFDWVKEAMPVFFNEPQFVPRTACMDHSHTFKNNVLNTWENCRIITCKTHVSACVKRKTLFNKSLIENDLRWLHELVLTDEMMMMTLGFLYGDWSKRGDVKFATEFRKVYGTPPFNRWYHCASHYPGQNSCANTLEGVHNGEKKMVLKKDLFSSAGDFLEKVTNKLTGQCPLVDGDHVSPRHLAFGLHDPMPLLTAEMDM